MKTNHQKILFLTSTTFVLFFVAPLVLLGANDFVALQPLPAVTYDEGFEGLFNGLFQIGVITAAFLAIIFIGIGGVQYMTTEAVSSKEDARKRITSALSGLFLVLLSVILLNVINPDIVKFTLFDGVDGLKELRTTDNLGQPYSQEVIDCGSYGGKYDTQTGECSVIIPPQTNSGNKPRIIAPFRDGESVESQRETCEKAGYKFINFGTDRGCWTR